MARFIALPEGLVERWQKRLGLRCFYWALKITTNHTLSSWTNADPPNGYTRELFNELNVFFALLWKIGIGGRLRDICLPTTECSILNFNV